MGQNFTKPSSWMSMLRLAVVITIFDKMKNEYIKGSLDIHEKFALRFLGNIVRREEDHISNKKRLKGKDLKYMGNTVIQRT